MDKVIPHECMCVAFKQLKDSEDPVQVICSVVSLFY